MSLDFKDDDEIIGMWFVGNSATDWLAAAWASKGKIIAKYRHRYHRDEKVWNSEDEKHWYQMSIEDTPEAREKLFKSFSDLWSVGITMLGATPGDPESCGAFAGGTPKEALDWLTAQPFCSVMTINTEAWERATGRKFDPDNPQDRADASKWFEENADKEPQGGVS